MCDDISNVFMKYVTNNNVIALKNRNKYYSQKLPKLKNFERSVISITENPVLKKNSVLKDIEKMNNIFLKKISKKKIKIEKIVDLHGFTKIKAEEQIEKVIRFCFNNKQRLILFIVGKGKQDTENIYQGVLKNSFTSMISNSLLSDLILSYSLANPEHGGFGAYYVYLRKN